MHRRHLRLLFFVAMLAAATLACNLSGNDAGPPRNANVIEVTANSSLQPWLLDVVASFNQAEFETEEGPAYVQLAVVEAGQAVSQMSAGSLAPAVWIPDDKVWANVLADQGNPDYNLDCVSVAESPLVIAVWRPVAESLGWPARDLGWLDIGSLAADPTAWAYYSPEEYGDALRLGHTHPGLSATGASTLLAIVQAAQSKSDAVTVADIEEPIVQASVGAFESAVSWFSSNTDSLGQTMAGRGPSFLGAAVMYESTVVNYGDVALADGFVPIYPFEGTFMATNPACISASAGTAAQEAAGRFRDYLLSDEAQAQAVESGLRPVAPAVTTMPAELATRGVDWAQPTRVFSPPSVAAIYAVQDVWQSARKDVNLVMLLDVSGSMAGNKIDNMKSAAVEFVSQMGDDDRLTLIAFSDRLNVVARDALLGDSRDQIVAAIGSLEANGDTALYDAIGLGSEIIAESTAGDTTNAMVVLTDGLDTFSYRYRFDDNLITAASANDTTVFTIAYGSDADEELLQTLASQAFGNYYLGTEASIAGIYEEMSAAFGGSLGVGR